MTVLQDFKEYVASEWSQLFDGCNWIHYSRRSRRKAAAEGKENLGKFGPGKTRPGSVAGGGGRPHKSASTEFSVCDSMDEDVLRRLTMLPRGTCPNEWMASHTLGFFHHVNALHGAITEFCTPDSCPAMSCPGFQHLPWVDDKGKKWKYSAPQYIDCVLSFCEKTNCSEDLFPTKYGSHFSPAFDAHTRRVIRLLWQVCGHLYLSHWDQLCSLGLRGQAAAVFAHLKLFADLFSLLDAKDAAALAQTVAVVRPPVPMVEGTLSRHETDAEHTGTAAGAEMEPMDTSEQPMMQRQCGISGPPMGSTQWKSGSWGGVPSATNVDFTCKPCAQTC